MDRLAKRLKLRKVSGTVVHHCALLIKTLKGGEMVRGWAIYGTECCEHYWVVHEGANYDIGYEVACLYTPELKAVQPVLCTTKPTGVLFVDDTEPIREKNAEFFDLWKENPKTFWREAPNDVKTLQV
jgi:hypothetical protein